MGRGGEGGDGGDPARPGDPAPGGLAAARGAGALCLGASGARRALVCGPRLPGARRLRLWVSGVPASGRGQRGLGSAVSSPPRIGPGSPLVPGRGGAV